MTAPSLPTQPALTRVDSPRRFEAVVGRLLELVVYSVEGIRDRLRGRLPAH